MSVFGSYSNYYDLLYKDKDYPAEVDFIESLFKKYGTGKIKTILDMGCGTGGHALLLAERGYSVTGIDMSESMLSIAKEKARKANISLDFFEGDIREFNTNKKFDAITSMFAVMGYQIKNDDLKKAVENARKQLKNNGLFIFDVWFGPAVIAQKPGDRIKIIQNESEKIIRLTRSSLNIMKHTVDVNFDVMVIHEDKIKKHIEEKHEMRFFFPQEIIHYLEDSGFELLKICPFLDLNAKIDENNWNITVIAKVPGEIN
jgi:SAM-dependent methyltransferase